MTEKKKRGRPPSGDDTKIQKTFRIDPALVERAQAIIDMIPRGEGWTFARVVEEGIESIVARLEAKYGK